MCGWVRTQHNVDAMLATLEPLHRMMERGAETIREVSFVQPYGRDLVEAREWCKKYQLSGKEADLNQAYVHLCVCAYVLVCVYFCMCVCVCVCVMARTSYLKSNPHKTVM